MASTTNYSWSTPDDTALVKDGAAAIRTLGSSIDTTTKALNPSTTLGDIEYRSATANTNTRLAIGTSGQVLLVSGGVPAWGTPAAGGMTVLASGSMPAATSLNISGIASTYKDLRFVMQGMTASSGEITPIIRVNADTSAIYQNQASSSNAAVALDGTSFYIGSDIASTFATSYVQIDVYDYTNTSTFKRMQSTSFTRNAAGGANNYLNLQKGVYGSSSAISQISIGNAGGVNFNAGTYILYGVS
jgi:hypothetical protein